MLDHTGTSHRVHFYDSPDGDLGRDHRPISQYTDPSYTPFDGPLAQNQTLLDDEDRVHDEHIRPGYNLITAEQFAPQQKSEAYSSQTETNGPPNERKKRKQYKPISMRTAYLVTVVIIAFGLLALVEVAIRKLPTDTVNPADLLKYDVEYVIRSSYTSELIASSKASAEKAASTTTRGLSERDVVIAVSTPPPAPAFTTAARIAGREDGRCIAGKDVTPVTPAPSTPSFYRARLKARDVDEPKKESENSSSTGELPQEENTQGPESVSPPSTTIAEESKLSPEHTDNIANPIATSAQTTNAESYHDDRTAATPPPKPESDAVTTEPSQEPTKATTDMPVTPTPTDSQNDQSKKPSPETEPHPVVVDSSHKPTEETSKPPAPEVTSKPEIVTKPEVTPEPTYTKIPEDFRDDRTTPPPPEDDGRAKGNHPIDQPEKPPPEENLPSVPIAIPSTTSNYRDDRSKTPPAENVTPTITQTVAPGDYRDDRSKNPPLDENSVTPPKVTSTKIPDDYRDDRSKKPPPVAPAPSNYQDDRSAHPPNEEGDGGLGKETPPITTPPKPQASKPPSDFQDDRSSTPPKEDEPSKVIPPNAITTDTGFRDSSPVAPPENKNTDPATPVGPVPGKVTVQWPDDDEYRDAQKNTPPNQGNKGKLTGDEDNKDGSGVSNINVINDDSNNVNVNPPSNVAPEEPPASIGHVDPGPIKPINPTPTPDPSTFHDSEPATPPAEEGNNSDQEGGQGKEHKLPEIIAEGGYRDTDTATPPTPTGIIAEYPPNETFRDGNTATPPPSEDLQSSSKDTPDASANSPVEIHNPNKDSTSNDNNKDKQGDHTVIPLPIPIQIQPNTDKGKTLNQKIQEWVSNAFTPKKTGETDAPVQIPSFVSANSEKPAGGSVKDNSDDGIHPDGGTPVRPVNNGGNNRSPSKDEISNSPPATIAKPEDGSDPSSIAFVDVTTVNNAGKTAVVAIPIPSPATSIDRNGNTVVIALQPPITTKDSSGKPVVTTPGIVVTTRLPKELEFFSAAVDDHGRLVVLPAPVTQTQDNGLRLVTTPAPITKTDAKGETMLGAPPVTRTKGNGDYLVIQPPIITRKSDGSGISIIVPAKTTTALPSWKTTMTVDGKTITMTDIKAPEATKFNTNLKAELRTVDPSRILTTKGRTWLLPEPTATSESNLLSRPKFSEELRMPTPKLTKNNSEHLVETWPELYPILNVTHVNSVTLQYIGVVVALIYAFLWHFTDVDIKRLEQYYQLARPQGGLIKDTIGYEYTTTWIYFAPWIGFRKRQWAPMVSSLAIILSAAICPALATTVVVVKIHPLCFDKSLDWQKDVYCVPQTIVEPIWARIMQVVIGLVALCGIVLIFLLSRRKTGVFGDPAAISGVASLAAEDALLDAIAAVPWREKESALVKKLGNRRLFLSYFNTPNGYEYGLHSGHKSITPSSSTTDIPNHVGTEEPADDENARNGYRYVPEELSLHAILLPYASSPERAFVLYWSALSIFAVLHIALIVIIFVYRYTGGNTGFEHFMSGDTAIVRFLFTLAATAVKSIWDPLDRDIRLLAPWRRLARGNQPAEKTIHREYTHNVPLYTTVLSLLRHDWLVAMTTWAAMCAELLTIFISSVPYAHAYTKFQNSFAGFFCASLLCYLLGALAVIMLTERQWCNTFPRMPYTHLSILSYIWGSRFRCEYEGLGDRTRRERMERVYEEERVRRYGFGWLTSVRWVSVGQAGRYTVGVDEEPLVKKWGNRSVIGFEKG